MDAMIGLVTNNLNGNPISSTNPVPAYSRYTATYSDGVEIEPNHLLSAGYSETFKVTDSVSFDSKAINFPEIKLIKELLPALHIPVNNIFIEKKDISLFKPFAIFTGVCLNISFPFSL